MCTGGARKGFLRAPPSRRISENGVRQQKVFVALFRFSVVSLSEDAEKWPKRPIFPPVAGFLSTLLQQPLPAHFTRRIWHLIRQARQNGQRPQQNQKLDQPGTKSCQHEISGGTIFQNNILNIIEKNIISPFRTTKYRLAGGCP